MFRVGCVAAGLSPTLHSTNLTAHAPLRRVSVALCRLSVAVKVSIIMTKHEKFIVWMLFLLCLKLRVEIKISHFCFTCEMSHSNPCEFSWTAVHKEKHLPEREAKNNTTTFWANGLLDLRCTDLPAVSGKWSVTNPLVFTCYEKKEVTRILPRYHHNPNKNYYLCLFICSNIVSDWKPNKTLDDKKRISARVPALWSRYTQAKQARKRSFKK